MYPLINEVYYIVGICASFIIGLATIFGVYWRLANRQTISEDNIEYLKTGRGSHETQISDSKNRLSLAELSIKYLRESQSRHDLELNDQRNRLDNDLKEMNKTLTEIRVSIESLKPKQ